VVSTSTSHTDSPASLRVASMPSMPGIRMSISTTSGSWSRATDTAASPSAASPTTSMSGAESRIITSPVRIAAWSSATTTRMGPAFTWPLRPERAAAARHARASGRRPVPP
jgi:hypothetical protein